MTLERFLPFRPRFALFLFSAMLVGCISSLAAKELHPGQMLDLSLPDEISGSCSTFFSDITDIDSVPFCFIGDDADPGDALLSRVFATFPLQRVSSELVQHSDFSVAPAAGTQAVLQAQVSGAVDVRGFMTLIGVGEVGANILVEVIDVTGDNGAPMVIGRQKIAAYDLNSVFSPSVSLSLEVEGGAPYIGGGVGVGGSFTVNMYRKAIRDSVDFGFQVLLQRGKEYQLRVVSESNARMGAAGSGIPGPLTQGRAHVNFTGIERARNLVEQWQEMLLETREAGLELPQLGLGNHSLATGGSEFRFPVLTTDNDWSNFSVGGMNVPLTLPLRVSRTNEALNELFDQANLFRDIDLSMAQFFPMVESAALPEERILNSGIRVSRLSILLQDDTVELLEEIRELLHTPPGQRPVNPSGRP